MDTPGEARTSPMAVSNGFSRRRPRTSDDSHAEIMQEGVRLRDRPEKKERDRESLNRNKRRRSDRFAVKNERDTEEDSSDESLDDEDIPISQHSASFQPNHPRKSFPPARVPRHAMTKTGMGPSLQTADEMIGVPVPRKARSACIKRGHDGRTSSGSGGGRCGDDHCINSFEAASPSTSIVSGKQKMNVNRSMSRVRQPLKSSGTMEDDLEFEIAEVLSGLKKQPRSPKKEEDSHNSLKSPASKSMKTKADASSAHVDNASTTYTVRTENGNSGNMGTSMAEPGRSSEFNPGSHRTAGSEAAEASCAVMDIQNGAQKQEQLDCPAGVMERKRLGSQDSTATKGVSEGPQSRSARVENYADNKLELCLMVPPPMAHSPGRDSLALASGPYPIGQDYSELESSENRKEKLITQKDTSMVEIEEKGVQNRDGLKLDLEKQSQDTVGDSSTRLRNQGQNQQLQAKSAQAGSVWPLPIAAGGWPPPMRYVPQLHTVKPVDGITGSPKMQAAPVAASQPRPKRCATHFFIARNVQLHQQFVKTNHIWVPNPGSVSPNGGGCGSMPNNLYAIPPPSAEGNPSLHGSFPILNLNSLAQDNEKIVANENGHSAEVTQKKPQLPAASSNLVPAPAFIFPINHNQHPVMGAANHQSVPSKSSGPTKKNPFLASGSTSVSFSYPSTPACEASPYLTILPNNGYSFQVSTPPAVRGGASGQVLSFFNGSLYSPQMVQPPQLLQKPHKESGSLSSHRQRHPQLGLANVQKQHLHSTAHQSQNPETKTSVDNMTVPMSFASFGGSGAAASLNFTSNGFQMVNSPQVTQRKGQQQQINLEDMKRAVSGSAPARTNGQTLVFDNSGRTLNFTTGAWPCGAVTVAASPQKHQMPQRQAMGRSKASSLGATSWAAAKFPKSVVSVMQTESGMWKSPAANSSPLRQQQQGETEICFGAGEGEQEACGQKRASCGGMNKTGNAAEPASGSKQKVCGRNMTTIISSGPSSHVSELKY